MGTPLILSLALALQPAAAPTEAPAAQPAPAAVVSQPAPAPAPASAPAPAPASAPAPAPAPAPAAPQADVIQQAPASQPLPAPQLQEERGLRVARPAYDLGIESVEMPGANGSHYKLSARRWRDIVREDPELYRLHRRGRLLIPGIVLLSVGTVFLATSTALAFDGVRTRTAIGGLFRWGIPGAMAVAGAAMTGVGAASRRQLIEAKRRMYVAPYASREGGGVAAGGRF